MGPFVVLVYENAHYRDDAWTLGRFASHEEAEAAGRRLVDASLEEHLHPGLTAEALFRLYTTWGDDPVVLGSDEDRRFSAWDYARERCRTLCGAPSPDAP